MGLGLAVHPMKHHELEWWLGHERLSFNRDYGLFDKIKKLPISEIPDGKTFSNYLDEGIADMNTDPWGKPLTFVRAKWFKKLETLDDLSEWNYAIISFLRQLPSETPVILYWC